MKIQNTKPPNYEDIIKTFDLESTPIKPIFCYGDTIYNPFNIEITKDLIAHESVHMGQQGDDPTSWWDKYMADISFRKEQEIPAYKAQFQALCKEFKDRNTQIKILHALADGFSGPIYNNCITKAEALKEIRGII